MKQLLLFVVFCSSVHLLIAQQNLPYLTGFDNIQQQAGWQEYRTGYPLSYNWSIASFGYISPPNCLTHDYPVGSQSTDTTTDWYVSPAINFTAGAKLSLKFNVYSITGLSTPIDQFGIWYSSGNPDPSTSSYTLITELKNYASSNSVMIDTSGIIIPSQAGTGYIAIKYQATNNWFVITLDDIKVESQFSSGVPSVHQDQSAYTSILLSSSHQNFPNPLQNADGQITIYDLSGRVMTTMSHVVNHEEINTDLKPGMYLLVSESKEGRKASRVIVQ